MLLKEKKKTAWKSKTKLRVFTFQKRIQLCIFACILYIFFYFFKSICIDRHKNFTWMVTFSEIKLYYQIEYHMHFNWNFECQKIYLLFCISKYFSIQKSLSQNIQFHKTEFYSLVNTSTISCQSNIVFK